MAVPGIPRLGQKQKTHSWLVTARRAVGPDMCGEGHFVALIRLLGIIMLILSFYLGRTSMSSNSRTHVPYFRYFGPTAIVPGFKQMVGRSRTHRRTQYLTDSKVVQVRGSRKSNPSMSSGESHTTALHVSKQSCRLILSSFVSRFSVSFEKS